MEQKNGVGVGMVPLYVPPEHYETMVSHLASVLAGRGLTSVIYQRDEVEWTEAEVREFAAAAGKWEFAESYVGYIAERAPAPVEVQIMAKDLKVDPGSIGGKLSGLGKWLKQHGKIRPGAQGQAVWPLDTSYDAAGRAVYRMSEAVAKVILEVIG
jgi:hypothetical protein